MTIEEAITNLENSRVPSAEAMMTVSLANRLGVGDQIVAEDGSVHEVIDTKGEANDYDRLCFTVSENVQYFWIGGTRLRNRWCGYPLEGALDEDFTITDEEIKANSLRAAHVVPGGQSPNKLLFG